VEALQNWMLHNDCIAYSAISFSMTVSFVTIQDNEQLIEYPFEFNTVAAEFIYENEAAVEQEITENNCLDCDNKCCSCCSNNLVTLVAVRGEIKSAELLFNDIESTQFDSPYYSLLRPPKHLNKDLP